MDPVDSHEPLIYLDETVALIDIPASIAHAQGTSEHPFRHVLLSRQPIEQPFPNNEPKTEKSKQRVLERNPELVEAPEYRALIEDALRKLHECNQRPFCLPRKSDPETEPHKRKQEPNHKGERKHKSTKLDSALSTTNYAESDREAACHEKKHDFSKSGERSAKFFIPPNASFIVGNVESDPQANRKVWKSAIPKFDFILLDPPWPNRSAERKLSYSVYGNMTETDRMLRNLRVLLEPRIKDFTYVALWVTNNANVRKSATKFLESLRVKIIEEWVWVKTTKNGEPILPLDGIWRQPYEILFVAQASNGYEHGGCWTHEPKIIRRAIVAVPDLHSRKPCLKLLLERWLDYIKKHGEYAALEIFARHLVAGWTSWGNECLKFQDVGCWITEDEEHSDTKPVTISVDSLIDYA